jgi:predicted DNA-binding protein (MmcQ/YjbR family)
MANAKHALMERLECKPGAMSAPAPAPTGRTPLAVTYKIKGKMFAIVSMTSEEFVIVKADPYRVDLLKEAYTGIGHRSHLDRRHWISISLNGDVPWDEIESLVDR